MFFYLNVVVGGAFLINAHTAESSLASAGMNKLTPFNDAKINNTSSKTPDGQENVLKNSFQQGAVIAASRGVGGLSAIGVGTGISSLLKGKDDSQKPIVPSKNKEKDSLSNYDILIDQMKDEREVFFETKENKTAIDHFFTQAKEAAKAKNSLESELKYSPFL